MGFFSFLSPEQEQDSLPKAKGYVPQGWKVRKPGEDFWRNDETETSEGDELRAPDDTPVATQEEMKPYSQRRGESSSKVFAVADQIVDKVADALPYFKQEAEETKRAVRANPADAAKAVEKFYENVKKSNPGTSFEGKPILPDIYDHNFTALENGVRALRSMQRGSEEQLLQGKLKTTDTGEQQKELQILQAQLDAITKDIANKNVPESVSKRGEEENRRVLGDKEAQAAAIAEHIKQLKAQTGAVEKPEEVAQPEAPVDSAPVTNFMKGVGVTREQLVPRLHAALNKVGIPPDQWEDQNVDPSAGMMRVLSELDPKGQFAQLMVQQLATARQEDLMAKQNVSGKSGAGAGLQAGSGAGATDETERAIEGKEARMRQLYAELRQAPFMQTWPGMILYVLVGIVTQNPAFAARLIGGIGNRAAVDAEMKGLHYDLKRLDDKLHYERQNEIYSKREAARRMTKKEDEADQRKWEYAKMMIQHQLIIKRNEARGSADTSMLKKLSSSFQRNLGMASKFQGTMQNEFADPKDRAEAKTNWTYYMKKAAELDQQIQQLGGAATTPAEQEEGAQE